MVNMVESSDKRIANAIKGVIKNHKPRENLCLKDKWKVIDFLVKEKNPLGVLLSR